MRDQGPGSCRADRHREAAAGVAVGSASPIRGVRAWPLDRWLVGGETSRGAQGAVAAWPRDWDRGSTSRGAVGKTSINLKPEKALKRAWEDHNKTGEARNLLNMQRIIYIPPEIRCIQLQIIQIKPP